jgi:hypothetical protein
MSEFHEGFDVFMAVNIHVGFFWVVTPCCVVVVRHQHFGGPCCHHLQYELVKMEKTQTSETVVSYHNTAASHPRRSHLEICVKCGYEVPGIILFQIY